MAQALEAARAPPTGSERQPVPTAIVSADEPSPVAPDAAEASTGGLLPEGERRRVTIVASTLSGYDGMVGRLAPEEVERIVARIREEAAAVAALHGGTLNHFGGDELILLFGVPVTHEDDGVRAVRSALELHARVRTLSDDTEREGGPRLRLHTGIDTGRVIVRAAGGTEDRAYRIVGSAGQIAPRLASHAGVDEVWASAECQRLIAPLFETEPQSALAVRDREQPLIPHRVVREVGSQGRLVARGAVGLTPYVGRTVEVATLERCLESALRGEGRFVTVTGEAGIGKSRLLHEFRATLDTDLVSCVQGRCQADGGGVPYLPFVEILRGGLGLGEAGPGGVLASTVARIREIGAELEEFIPFYLHLLSVPGAEFRMPRDLDGDSLRLAFREALAAILTLSARRRPIVVLVEDAHWADDASRSVLEDLADLVSGHRLMVVVTTRPRYGRVWRAADQPTSIQLLPLDPTSLVVLLKAFLRVQDLTEGLGALLQERTGGNPFFLEEICTALVEEGAIRIEGGEARPSGPLQMLDLPDSIEAVIRARLDRLDRNARDVLRLASVVGREFTRGILEQTVTDGARLPEALDALKAAGLVQQTRIVPEPTYRFKHVLTREVAYASLLEHQRRDLHGRVGAHIEQLGQDIEDHLERLAHHFARAEAWAKAIDYGIRSADRAGGLAQYAEALQILERAQRRLIELPEGGERQDAAVEILLRQERLCETMGLRGRQRQIIDELIRLLEPGGDPAKLAEAYLRRGDLHALLRHFEEGEEALQRSLLLWRELADETGERRALRSLGLLRWYEGRNAEALTCIEAVIAIDRERDDVVALMTDLISVASVLKAMGLATQATLRLQEGLAIAATARAAGSPVVGDVRVKEAYILNSLSNFREAGDLAGALELLDRAGEIAEVKRLPVYLSYNRTLAAHICLQQGRIEECLAHYREAVELTRKARFVPGLAQTLRIHGEVLLGLTRFDEAIPCLEEAAELFAQLEDREAEALMWAQIGRAREGAGDDKGAIAAWSASRVLRQATGDAAGELEALEGLAAALRRHDPDPSPALACYRHAAELAESLELGAVEGRLRNVVGILEWGRGEYARALREYERALILFRALGDAPNAGLMLNSIAVTLGELDRTEEARGRLDEAIVLHRETGQLRLEGHALAALGDFSSRAGDAETARRHYRRSLEVRRRIGDDRGEGWMLYQLARNGGAGGRAAEWTARASQIAEGCGDRELAAACARLQRIPTA
jgi:class 3 adenylate cyclase/tetratricopeptide (TPR) repeat protein